MDSERTSTKGCSLMNRCIALLGIGHTNAYIVRQWARDPIPDCRLVCISKFPTATYSGMLPGTLAGQFSPEQMQVELQPLIQRAGAELVLDEVTGLDPQGQELRFANRAALRFDALSVGVGSMPAGWHHFDSPALVPIKPMQTFIDRLDSRIDEIVARRPSPTISIVGGGVSGVEVALCLQTRIHARHPGNAVKIQIVTGGAEIAVGLNPRSVARLRRVLSARSIEVVAGFRVVSVTDAAVENAGGEQLQSDCVIWATAAAAPPILSKLNLPTDERGFLATDRNLRTTAGRPIFAVGDSGTVISDPAPKAGVYAVRQAPILWHNLKATIAGRPLLDYHAQKDFLKIVNTGDGRALLEYGRFTFYHRWCWRLKSWIDTRFIADYQQPGKAPAQFSHSSPARAA
jgi:pyridine nucleotide-disulfide oxidoreductase family protein